MSSLYDPVLVRHARTPRHRGSLAGACSATGVNRPCGDRLQVFVRDDAGQVVVSFEGEGCALAIAAASALCEGVQGLAPTAARALAEAFCDALARPVPAPGGAMGPAQAEVPEGPPFPGDLGHFLAVRAYPARRSCVHLAPKVLLDALGVAALAPADDSG